MLAGMQTGAREDIYFEYQLGLSATGAITGMKGTVYTNGGCFIDNAPGVYVHGPGVVVRLGACASWCSSSVCVCVVLQAIWGTLSAPSCDIAVVC